MDSSRQVDEVKSKVDIVSLVGEYVQLKKAGRNYKANCPFHNEKTPSFMVSPDRQIFKCFGCGEGGDVFAFLNKMEGLEFGESLRFLAGKVGVQLKDYKPSPAEKRKDTLLEISSLANNLFHYLLTKHKFGKNAVNYLESRRVSKKSIEKFALGFSPNQKNFLFKFLVKRGHSPQDIIASGLAISTSDGPVDRFRSRITFPIMDIQGRIIAFSGRSLGSQEPKYLNSPETAIFSKSKALYGINLAKAGIKKDKSAVLVEGNLDVVSSHQVGVENTVAPLGTALTIQQVENLKKLTDTVIFAFDTDLAGDAAAKRGIEIVEAAGLSMKVAQLPEGKDPDDLIKKSPTLWKDSLKKSTEVYNYLIDSAIRKYGTKTAESKTKIVDDLKPLLTSIDNQVKLNEIIHILSSKAAIEEADLRDEIKKHKTGSQTPEIEEVLEKPLTPKTGNVIEKYLSALLVQGGQDQKQVTEDLFSENPYREIFKFFKKYKKEHEKWKVKDFARGLPVAILPTFDDILLFEIDPQLLEQPEKLEQEVESCSSRLRQLSLRKELKKLSLEIKQAEAVGDSGKIRLLSEEFRDRSRSLAEMGTS